MTLEHDSNPTALPSMCRENIRILIEKYEKGLHCVPVALGRSFVRLYSEKERTMRVNGIFVYYMRGGAISRENFLGGGKKRYACT